MCTTAIITGAICFLIGFGLGRFLSWTKQEHEEKNTIDSNKIVLTIHALHG